MVGEAEQPAVNGSSGWDIPTGTGVGATRGIGLEIARLAFHRT
jgi:hypothetical protein